MKRIMTLILGIMLACSLSYATVTDQTQRIKYTATDLQTAFPYTWRVLDDGDMDVYVDGVLTTAYSVSNVGVLAGGNITFNTGRTAGEIITILRNMPETQETGYPAGGRLSTVNLELNLDRLTMLVQDLEEQTRRTIILPVTSDQTDVEFPESTSAALRADKFIAWDTAGTALRLVESVGTGVVSLPVSVANGGTGASTQADARTNLDISTLDFDAKLRNLGGVSPDDTTWTFGYKNSSLTRKRQLFDIVSNKSDPSDNNRFFVDRHGHSGVWPTTVTPIPFNPYGIQTLENPTAAMFTNSGFGNYTAAQLIDEDTGTKAFDADSASSGSTLKVDLGSTNDKPYWKIRMFMDAGSHAGTYAIAYSDDDATYVDVATGFAPTASGWNDVTWGDYRPHRYWRITLENTPGASADIMEVAFYILKINAFSINGDYAAGDHLLTHGTQSIQFRRLPHMFPHAGLNADIVGGTTSITVIQGNPGLSTDATISDYRAVIWNGLNVTGSEIVEIDASTMVDNGDGTLTFTIVRAKDSTAAASHSKSDKITRALNITDDTAVSHILSGESLGSGDNFGGSGVTYAPIGPEDIKNGYVEIVAHGRGVVDGSNAIVFKTRTSTLGGASSERARIITNSDNTGTSFEMSVDLNKDALYNKSIIRTNDIDRTTDGFVTIATLTPSASNLDKRGWIEARCMAQMDGTASGAVRYSRWYFDIVSGGITVGDIGTLTAAPTDWTDGVAGVIPDFQLTVSGGAVLIQIRGGTNDANGDMTTFVEYFCPSGGSTLTWTVN